MLACAQLVPVPGDLKENLRRHMTLALLASDRGATVLVFPELSLTGYELDRSSALSLTPFDERLRPLRGLCQRKGLTAVVGAPIQNGEKPLNGAFILTPSGEVLIHSKMYLGAFDEMARVDGELPPPEPEVFSAGVHSPVFQTELGPASVAICAEGNRPVHAQSAAARGAQVYLAASFVIPSEFAAATENLAERSRAHGMWVAFANFGGPSGGMNSAGGSSIWTPEGELLGRLPAVGAGVLVARKVNEIWTAHPMLAES